MLEDFGLIPHETPTTAALVGRKFTRLTVLAIGKPPGSYRYAAVCDCDCGTRLAARLEKITAGKTQSCGCYQRDRSATHGCWGHPIFPVWSHLMSRCYNKKDKRFEHYGGRGISVCEHWHDPNNFIENMYPSYERGLQLDRIDNDGNYEPSNCRWATPLIQQRNRGNVIRVTIGEKTLPLTEWCEINGVNPGTAHDRIRRGWSPEVAVTAKAKD